MIFRVALRFYRSQHASSRDRRVRPGLASDRSVHVWLSIWSLETQRVGGEARTSCCARITTQGLFSRQMVNGWSSAKIACGIKIPRRLG